MVSSPIPFRPVVRKDMMGMCGEHSHFPHSQELRKWRIGVLLFASKSTLPVIRKSTRFHLLKPLPSSSSTKLMTKYLTLGC